MISSAFSAVVFRADTPRRPPFPLGSRHWDKALERLRQLVEDLES